MTAAEQTAADPSPPVTFKYKLGRAFERTKQQLHFEGTSSVPNLEGKEVREEGRDHAEDGWDEDAHIVEGQPFKGPSQCLGHVKERRRRKLEPGVDGRANCRQDNRC